MRVAFVLFLFWYLASLQSCVQSNGNSRLLDKDGDYSIKVAFPKLSFTRPVDLQHSNDNTNRLFVVEQEGIISVFKNETSISSKKNFP
jgi:hypothetical protein